MRTPETGITMNLTLNRMLLSWPTQLPLGLSQDDPEFPPRRKLVDLGEVELHLCGGVAGVERGLVGVRHLE